jgi:hypothetical protein
MPSSSQGSLHTMFSSELMKNLAQTTPDSLKFPSTMFASESLLSLPASFATLDSFCSSTATAAAAHENVLQTGTSADTNVGLNTESIPSHISTSLNFGTPFSHGFKVVPPRFGKNLAAFYSTTNPQNTTVFSPLMPSSSQGSLHTMFSSELMKNLEQTTPDFLKFPSTLFASESLPSLPASFATLESFCSSTATAAATVGKLAKQLGPDLNQPGPSEIPSPAKKSKMETDLQKTRDDMAKMFKMLMYVMIEFKIMREWIATTVCPQMNVTAPPPNPSPAVDPPSENSTSSDDSSPTIPK